jgi:Rrf2 family transcriptional regulator, nitric oxide-sensitive transcriptional repressor
MQLSRFTDYSIRVLFYAAQNNQKLTTMAEVSRFYQISIEHLRKVIHNLAKAGYIKTYRGKKGGFELLKNPCDINLGDLIAHTEGMQPLINCQSQQCCLDPFCSLKKVLKEAQIAFIGSLNNYSIEDLLDNPQMQSQLISTQLIEK